MPNYQLLLSIVAIGLILPSAPASAAAPWNSETHQLVFGDFNNDGKDDLLYIAKAESLRSGIALSDGAAPSIDHQSWPSNHLGIPWHSGIYKAIVADFNGDGRADVLMQRQSSGDHYLIFANSTGKLTSIAQTIPYNQGGQIWSADAHRIVAGDFNGDGNSDVFLQANKADGLNAVFLANGSGHFGNAKQTWVNNDMGFQWSLAKAIVHAADFNGDGRADLLVQAKPDFVLIDYDVAFPVPRYRPGSFGIIDAKDENQEGKIFHTPALQTWSRNHQGVDWSAANYDIVVGDFNGDALPDIFLQGRKSGFQNRLMLANSSGQFQTVDALLDAALRTADMGQFQLHAANINGTGGAGLYLQAKTASGTNYIAADITTSSVVQSEHAPGLMGVGPPLHGKTSTSFDVSQAGEAQYTIPIFAPPGTHGMTPQVSFDYGHRGGGSLLGAGWGIAGLNAITRCPKTWAQDGEILAVEYTADDRYCLDGNRLRAYSGTYHQGGAEYRTEIETFSRITSSGNAGNTGPQSFKVETKEGRILEFGTTEESRIQAQYTSHVRVWALSQVSDREGNSIKYDYYDDTTNGSYRIKNIQYTGNTALGLMPAYKIDFIYETKPLADIDESYFAGTVVRETTRLVRVDVTYNSSLVRRYFVRYESQLSSAGQSRVESIQECAGPEVRCFPATNFTWQNGSVGLSAANPSSAVVAGIFNSYLPADINGDGISDVVYGNNNVLHYALGTASGVFASPVNTGVSIPAYAASIALPMDYNTDGREDILLPPVAPSTTWRLVPGTATGLGTPFDTGAPYQGYDNRAVDVNGDGLRDLVWTNVTNNGFDTVNARLRVAGGNFSSSTMQLWQNSGAGWSMHYYGVYGRSYRYAKRNPDWNGDGRDDYFFYLRYEDDTPTVQTHLMMKITGEEGATYGVPFDEIDYPYFIDVNGDGYTDIVYSQYTTWYYAINTGSGFQDVITLGAAAVNSRTTGLVIDWDSDGNDDFLFHNESTGMWDMFRSNGEQLLPRVSTGVPYTGGMAADANGDGMTDIIYSNTAHIGTRLRVGVEADVLNTATDGLGNVVDFDYQSISQGSHTRSTGATFPEVDWQGALHVVNQMTVSNGIGGNYSLGYSYGGARVNLQGREFQGFASRSTVDSRNGVYTHEFYKQAFPYAGLLYQVDVKRPDNSTFISSYVTTYDKHDYGSGQSARSYPYVKGEAQSEYSVGGAVGVDGQLLRTVAITHEVSSAHGSTYDTTRVTMEAASANGLAANQNKKWTERTLHTAFANDTTNGRWCIGRPTDTQQINSHEVYGGAQKTRKMSMAWNTQYCRTTQTKVGVDTAHWLTIDVLYDDFGNANEETISGSDITTRSNKAYWGTTGQFPRKFTDPYNKETHFDWDSALGLPTKETDPNNIAVEWGYDAAGRKTRTKYADGTETRWSFEECAISAFGCPSSLAKLVTRRSELDTSGVEYSDSAVFTDRYGRGIINRSRKADGTYSRSDVEYDGLGRIDRESFPCTWGACSPYWRDYDYDLLNRVKTMTRPLTQESGAGLVTSTITYDGLTTKYQDGLLKNSWVTRNAAGQTAKSLDMNDYAQIFDYNPFGQLVRVTDSESNPLQSYAYNDRGFLESRTDMDLGSWGFTMDALGLPRSQTNAKSQTAYFAFDLLGRFRTRTDNSVVTSEYVWGDAPLQYNVNKLASMQGPGYSEHYTYDNKGRRTTTRINAEGTDYYYGYNYNAIGELHELTYPASTSGTSPLKLRYGYSHGVLSSIRNADAIPAVPNFWTLTSVNNRGQVTQEALGNGASTTREFDQVTGLVSGIQTTKAGMPGIQNFSYKWDAVGNLKERKDILQSSLTENFNYDNLHRLDTSTLTGVSGYNLDVDYDKLGNIDAKSDVGDYDYHPTKKHQVTSIDRPSGSDWSFTYDENGNMLTGRGAAMEWTPDDLPKKVTIGTSPNELSSEFQYTPDRRYWKQVAKFSNGTATTTYLGGMLEKVETDQGIEYRHMIHAGDTTIIVTRGAQNDTYYVTKDHLGSTSAITDINGGVIVNESFAAFGKRRGSNWQGSPSQPDMEDVADITRRGFTGHTMLDNLGMIHMNGRVYDSETARFLSADPYIPDPLSTQEYNRYSYVSNNPLTFTDPSGFTLVPYCSANGCGEPPGWSPPGMTFRFNPTHNPAASALARLVRSYARSCYAYCRPVREALPAGSVVQGFSQPARIESSMRTHKTECGQEYCTPPIWADGQFYKDLAKNTWTEMVVNPINQAKETMKAIRSGDPKAIAVSGAAFACEVSKICDGIGSLAKNLWNGAKKLIKGCCFAAGTLVTTTAGAVPIENIEVGDLVLSRSSETGETAYKPVVDLIRRNDRELWELTVVVVEENGEVVSTKYETTEDHPWRTIAGEWVATAELQPGSMILRSDGDAARVEEIVRTGTTAPTYNLTVADFNTYFVGESRLWVHNASRKCELGDQFGGAGNVDAPSPTAGLPVDSKTREAILARDQKPDGSWECATCGQSTRNPDNIHTGHIKARSHGGDLSPENLRCEGAACNLSQGNRAAPKPGRTCKDRGSCGAPYGRSD